MITYERRYTGPRGKVAHLFDPIDRQGVHTALCGLWAWSSSQWYGSGSQDEIERAEALPTCRNCDLRRGVL